VTQIELAGVTLPSELWVMSSLYSMRQCSIFFLGIRQAQEPVRVQTRCSILPDRPSIRDPSGERWPADEAYRLGVSGVAASPAVVGSAKQLPAYDGLVLNRKRVLGLARLIGLTASYPKPRTTQPASGHRIYPYLLRNQIIDRRNQIWCTDITYLPMVRGFS